MTPEDIERYEKKSNSKFDDTNLIDNEHGFMSWKLDGESFVCLSAYGDGVYWDKYMNELAKQLGCTKILTSTERKSYKAYVRKYNFKLVGYILEKGVV
jgi:hypothetical protein|tara:strand:- start:5939 stop:6232 length:294 start_codon:yes stop_codon:yes gene_type:complete